ncbi:5-guanidino-2-oxopentanoate decarboxylase [Defluviimonas salinarum]|uniref:5-guanidino-2-oxopentanoate decarboxylase n=1 Tax=Defluviimonas salinarum TaxID=2992147 RepID=A0ABT3J6K5_9RHOB|nr:5-guanidino-2-oxopentanoate decarboxylase [Defluviimonas salinarum]MCW3783293.1 5-guanidino-2-oxopentanoate decarboxylase [Defluviimonas salinarum]
MSMTCGEATMRLLARYGVTTVFGIPGVHTLDLCRGLSGGQNAGAITHVQTRNEQGAGFMAEGWARATGEVGVAVVISGPGVTNAATAVGQCYADSLPMLLVSAEPEARTIGKGWGVLHEITEQKRATEPLCAFSATARRAADVPDLMARAFSIFASQRPRPCHISLPIDVQAEMVEEIWEPVALPARPAPAPAQIAEAARMLRAATCPVIMIGGGAAGAVGDLTAIADTLGAVVIASTAGKGIVADDHPLSLSASTVRPEVQAFLPEADVILAVGTELSETDSFIERMELRGRIIRVDIDPAKISDLYPATLGIVADAGSAMAALRVALAEVPGRDRDGVARVAGLRARIAANLSGSERRHAKFLALLDRIAPEGTVWAGDACQLVYTGAFAMPVRKPRHWFYPAGFCALGNALPNGIGAKLARPDAPVAVLAGDGGFMFTMPELVTAAEARLALPIVIWENGGLKQIQDDMDLRDIARVGVEGINPDFVALAQACHCHGTYADSAAAFTEAFQGAFETDRPTVIVVRENDAWLS